MIRTSESIDKLAFALVAAQAVMPGVPRATKGQVGNQVRYYTDLATVVEAVRPVLAAHRLAYVQFPCNTLAGHIGICTRLLHESGEWMEDEYSMPAGQGAQGAGSALTYAKRYALMAVLGIAADDDDGAAASQGQAKPRKAATAPPAAAPRVPTLDDRGAVPGGVTPAQLTKLGASFSDNGIKDREARLAFVAEIVGHSVESSKDLTVGEAGGVITALALRKAKFG